MLPVVVGGPEPLLFDSVESAERYMEPIDVREGEYGLVLDAEGRKLDIEIERSGRWLPREKVRLVRSSSPADIQAFRRALLDVLRYNGDDSAVPDASSTDELLTRAMKFRTI